MSDGTMSDVQTIIENLRAHLGLPEAVGDLLTLPPDADNDARVAVFQTLGPRIIAVLSGAKVNGVEIAQFGITDGDGTWKIIAADVEKNILFEIPCRDLITFH